MANKFQLPSIAEIISALPHDLYVHETVVTKWIQDAVADYRKRAQSGETIPDRAIIVERIVEKIISLSKPSLKSIINGTGIVLHTGFGRAPISKEILQNVVNRVTGYVNLEFDLESGKRGNRLDHSREILSTMIGAEDAVFVNNNAAAVLIALNTLAEGKEVIVSRGQQVEIGGSFRIPDIIKKSNCELVEIGTTNRTHLKDYENAISKYTGLILWVHTSNYTVQGFTKEVPLSDLVELGRKKRIPVMADLGSGALLDIKQLGLPPEIPVQDIIKTGVAVATFSGDKLLGGPQAGIIAGKRKVTKQIAANPLYRAMRCDKVTLALLEEILRSYKRNQVDESNLALSLLSTSRNELMKRANKILKKIDPDIISLFGLSSIDSQVEAGSGSLPVEKIESIAIQFKSTRLSASELAKTFRMSDPPIVGYIEKRTFYIDLKAVLPDQITLLAKTINSIGSQLL